MFAQFEQFGGVLGSLMKLRMVSLRSALLCCLIGFVGFARFGVFEGVTCFISAVNKTKFVPLDLFVVFIVFR